MPETPAVQEQPVAKRYEIPVLGDEPKEPAAKETPAEIVTKDDQNIAEQAPAAAPEGEKPATEKDDPEKQRGTRRFERRLDKAYRKAAEEKGRADFLAKQLEDLKPKAPVDESAPKLESFNTIDEFVAARDKYASEKAIKEHEAKQRTTMQQQMQERIAAEWDDKVSKGEDKYEDFEEKVGKLDPRIPMNIAIMQAENGHDIAHYLGTNLKEAERIIKLDPISQIREIGRLEVKLLAEPEKPKTPSKAPAPTTPLSGTAPVASDVPSEQDDTGAWIKKRWKQVHGARR